MPIVGTTAKYVSADLGERKSIANAGTGALYVSTSEAVSASEKEVELASGESTIVSKGVYIVSATTSSVEITPQAPSTPPSTATFLPGVYGGGFAPNTATTGTDTAGAEKKLFVTSVYLPVSKKCVGFGYIVGSVGGTNKAVAGLFGPSGEVLAKTSETTEGTTVGTAAEVQEIAFSTAYNAAPGLYYIGVTMNGNTAKLRTIPVNVGGKNIFTTEASLTTKNVLAAITAPTTFTGAKGPICWVY